MKSVGERLIQLRQEHGLTKIEMSQRLKVNKSTITRYESNEIKPNLDMLIEISNIFSVSLDWLAGFDVDQMRKYEPVVKECIESNISPEQLMKLINLNKEMAGLVKGE